MEALFAQIMEVLGSVEAQVGIIAVIVEFVLRLFKTEKPASVLYIIAGALKLAGAALAKAGALLDKVLPQRVEPVPAPVEAPKEG